MTNRTNPMRRHSRFPVSWSVLYGSDQLLAEGTVLDVTALGWRVAGTIPVIPGMRLTLQVWVPNKTTPLHVHRATVLWVKGPEFAIEVHEMAPNDQAWITEFLTHKLGLMWMSRAIGHEPSVQTSDETSVEETELAQPSDPCREDSLHRRLAIPTHTIDVPTAGRHKTDPTIENDEEDPLSDRSLEDTWSTSLRLIRGIETLRAVRARTGQDPMAGN